MAYPAGVAGRRGGVGEVEGEVRDVSISKDHIFLQVSSTNPLYFRPLKSVVLANGSTRLQLDIAKSSGLSFHMLFSSELLRQTKVASFIHDYFERTNWTARSQNVH